jgi:Methyltransferase domain
MDLREVESGVDPSTHWYFKSKARLLRSFGNRPIRVLVDVGSGSGYFAQVAARSCSPREVIQVDPHYEAESESNEEGTLFRKLKEKPQSFSQVDAILLMDVLEHVEDPQKLLMKYVEDCGSGCEYLITVPAFQFLWSDHDDFLGHYKRYRRHEIEELVSSCGLTVMSSGYFFSMIFPLAILQRKLLSRIFSRSGKGSSLRKSSPLVNWFLQLICSIEFTLSGGFGRLPGLSVVVRARR